MSVFPFLYMNKKNYEKKKREGTLKHQSPLKVILITVVIVAALVGMGCLLKLA